jgi:response regulator RpfG family c-di-GMP phosphodiesterase
MKSKNYRKVNVLIVEGSPDDSEITIQAVKRGNKNANIIHLWNGKDLLDYVQDHLNQCKPIDDIKLIMLNLKLPKMDGFEVLKKLRENPVTKYIPIVILTSSEEEHKVSEAYKLGANSYVIKPTSYDLYMERVSSLAFYWSNINTWPTDFYRTTVTTKTKTQS